MRLPLHRHSVAIVSACAMLIASPNESALSAQTRLSAPRFTLRVPSPPTVVNGEQGAFLVYELHLTNFATRAWILQKVEVLSGTPDSRALYALELGELGLATVRPGTTIPADGRRDFAGGGWGVVMMWVPVDRAAPPASLSHRLTFASGNAAGAAASELQGGVTTVRRESVTIGPPLRGGPWRAGNFTNAGAHRRGSMFGYGGDATINSRFAIDYVKHGPDDRAYAGERARNENWHAYAQEVVAVADGLVASTSDGIADNTLSGAPGPPDLQTIRGNHIILEIAPKVYATYAHLKPGSLRVAMGQRVTRGQVIGQVGNTGASGAPHLHFQLSEAPDVTSDGVPYAHDAFEVVARCRQTGATLADQTCAHVPPEMHRGEIPLQGMLVRFPEEPPKAREPARAVSPRDAIDRAIPLLQSSAQTWTRERRCASCHHQGLGTIALAMARERGFPVDESMLRAQLGAVRASLASAEASVNLPANTNYIDDSLWLAALGSVGDPRGLSTDLVVHRLLSGQHVDGHWIPYPFRPPIEGSLIANTAWTIRALRPFMPPSRAKQVDAAVGRARDWIVKQTPDDTQDLAMKLLALRWSGGGTDRVVTETARRLIALQRADGGWSQTRARASDAYATGQALVALNQAADVRPTDAAFAKGVAFLTRSQHQDGSWLVETRRTWRRGIPFFESGFPHGTHQFISYAGAAWATMALVLADRHAPSVALIGHPAKHAAAVPLAASAESDAEISSTLTPLMRAALWGSVDEMRSVLKEKPDVNATATQLAITALMCAAHDAAKVRLLIDAGATVRAATIAGHTALLVAADYAGAAESVRVLLQHGADPNVRTKAFLATPLARATLHGDRTAVALLLDAGAAVNDGPDGSVALVVATNQGDTDMVTLLLDRGANIESHPQATVPITNGEQLPTPLMLAADRQWSAIVTLLLGRGANPNARDRQGMTPLMYAAGAIQTAVNPTPVIETLIAAKADVDARAANGDTALGLAERYGNEPAITALKAAQRPRRQRPSPAL
jgi:murein DD-endopeptidase